MCGRALVMDLSWCRSALTRAARAAAGAPRARARVRTSMLSPVSPASNTHRHSDRVRAADAYRIPWAPCAASCSPTSWNVGPLRSVTGSFVAVRRRGALSRRLRSATRSRSTRTWCRSRGNACSGARPPLCQPSVQLGPRRRVAICEVGGRGSSALPSGVAVPTASSPRYVRGGSAWPRCRRSAPRRRRLAMLLGEAAGREPQRDVDHALVAARRDHVRGGLAFERRNLAAAAIPGSRRARCSDAISSTTAISSASRFACTPIGAALRSIHWRTVACVQLRLPERRPARTSGTRARRWLSWSASAIVPMLVAVGRGHDRQCSAHGSCHLMPPLSAWFRVNAAAGISAAAALSCRTRSRRPAAVRRSRRSRRRPCCRRPGR